MTARTAADSGRRFAEAQMVDECTITRDGVGVYDPDTGELEPGTPTTIYTGKCRLRTPSPEEERVLFGEQQVTKTRYILDVPHTTRGVRIEDVAALTTTEDTDAAALRIRVVAATAETIFVMKSYPCETVSAE